MTIFRIRLLIIATLCLLIVFGVIAGLYLYLPVYIETRLVPQLSADMGLGPLDVEVRHIGLSGTDLGPVRLGADAPAAQIAAIQIDYTPFGLLHRRIDGITISGLRIDAVLEENGVTIAGFRLPFGSAETKQGQALDSHIRLPVGLGHLSIQSALVTVHWGAYSLQVPFEVELETGGFPKGALDGKLRLSPRGNTLVMTAAVNTRANGATITLSGKHVLLDSFADFLEALPGLSLHGLADVDGGAKIQLQPFELADANLAVRLDGTQIAGPDLSVSNARTGQGQALPILLEAKTDGPGRWRWSCAPFLATGPARIEVSALDGRLVFGLPGWSATASGRASLPSQVVDMGSGQRPLRLDSLAIQLELQANRSGPSETAFSVNAHGDTSIPKGVLALEQGPIKAFSPLPRIELNGTYNQGRLLAQWKVAGGNVRVQMPSLQVNCPQYMLAGKVDTASDVPVAATARLTNLTASAGSAKVEIPRIIANINARRKGDLSWSATGQFKLDGGQVKESHRAIQVRDLSASLPLQWPLPTKGRAGKINANSIQWKNNELGEIHGRWFVQSTGVRADLSHSSKLFPGLDVHIEAGLDRSGADVVFRIPPYVPPADIDLGRFFPAAGGIRVNGRLEAQGEIAFKGTQPRGTAHVKVDRGRLYQNTAQLEAQGLSVNLHVADLLTLRSGHGQKLHLDSIRLGNIRTEQIDVAFQIEPPNTLFVEEASIKWCQGNVFVQSVRVKPAMENVDLSLICDRLNLAMVLQQFGAAQGSGEGTVNGRIPVTWHNGLLGFDNGFLYSTPGQPGTIKLQGTKALLAGLPKNTPQYTQLDIATEALKDYTYNWAKLKMESQGEILHVTLQLDGKPNQSLPFAYDQKLGIFKRVEGRGQAEFKGISIDLNFSSPLNEILNYRGLLSSDQP